MESSAATARTSQGRLSAVLLGVVVLTCLTVGLAAHFTPVFANRLASEIERHRAVNGMYFFNGGYVDDGDEVLIGQIPEADYSRGGVYFIGASETRMSIMPYLLPPEEQALIRNYSLGDLRHIDVLHYVRMLVEEAGLLSAGGEKTTVVLGMSSMMGRPRDWSRHDTHYVPDLFERHGFYTFDEERGIHQVAMSPVERFLRRERIYASRFLNTLVTTKSRVSIPTPEDHEEFMVYQMDDDWREEMQRQAVYVGETIDYLRSRGVRVVVLFPPIQSWQKQMPYQQHYRDVLRPVLKARDIEIADFSHMLPDSEFGDSVHARYTGQIQMHEAYAAIARKALFQMNAPEAADVHASTRPGAGGM